MISVDQIYLLQQKVESAVQKIEQLKSENDALRTKCSELTNALSEKTELLSSFMADEKKIESGILSALNRLNSVENALLDSEAMTPAKESDRRRAEAAPAPEADPEQDASAEPRIEESPSVPHAADEARQAQAADGEGFEFGADSKEKDSLFGDTSFETEDEETPQEIF